MIRTLLAICGICLPVCWGVAQEYAVRQYSLRDGLPQSQVTGLVEDINGYLWIGTMGGGLARFDGREFQVYTAFDGLLSNIVGALAFDAQQNLWISHPTGITKFDGVHFKRFDQPPNSKAGRVRRFFELGDTLFFLTNGGALGRIYRDSVHTWGNVEDEGSGINFFQQISKEEVLLSYRDSTYAIKSIASEVPIPVKGKLDGRVIGLFKVDGVPWLQTETGYFFYDQNENALVSQSHPVKNQILMYDSLNRVYWTRSGNLILREKIMQEHSIDTVLQDYEIMNVLVDLEGDTWFATNGSGLLKHTKLDFMHYQYPEITGIMAIHVDADRNLWAGSMTRGLWRIKDGRVKHYEDRVFGYRNSIGCINSAPNGTVWIGSGAGLGRYDKNNDRIQWYTEKAGISGHISAIVFDSNNTMWVGGSRGLWKQKGDSFSWVSLSDSTRSQSVQVLCYDPLGNYLFAGTDEGVYMIDKQGRITLLDFPELMNSGVLSIDMYKNDYLLIGSGGSGVILHNLKESISRTISSRDGLLSDFIYFVAADKDNYIWVGTEKGINRLLLDDQLNASENLRFNDENGLSGIETNHNAYFFDGDKKYFGLIDGLYSYNNVMLNEGKTFDLHLTDVSVFYGDFAARDYSDSVYGFYKIPANLRLPSDKNHITFKFNRVDKRYPGSVKFKYFLENFDNTWSLPLSSNQVTYSNLPPGNYVFHVVGTNKFGSWETASLGYPFTITAPFYQTIEFFVVAGVLLVGVVFFMLYLRVKRRVDQMIFLEHVRQEEQEALRKEIARDFHDEMGNQLTRIINYVSQLKMNSNGDVSKLYTKVEESAKNLYTGTRDFIWSIDPVNDELSQLFIHIKDFGEKLFEEKNVDFRTHQDIHTEVKLPYGFSREANLIFKEVMTNSFKHANARNARLSLHTISADHYVMEFEDDGIGFSIEEVGRLKTNGLKNIRHRADRIDGSLEVSSMPGKGTKIVLNIYLKKPAKYGTTL